MIFASWLRIWKADSTDGSTVKARQSRCRCRLAAAGSAPEFRARWSVAEMLANSRPWPTASRPVDGPAMMTLTWPITPKASIAAMTLPSHGSAERAQRSR